MIVKKPMMLGVMLGGLLALAACGLEETSGMDAEEAYAGMTVIDAVQLGAAQSCHRVAGTVDGNLAVLSLRDGEGLALLVEDDYPLCIDTMESIAAELASIEDTYIDEIGAVETTQEPDDLQGLVPMMIQTPDTPGDAETDPNPQPALGTNVKIGTASSTTVTPGTPLPGTKPSPSPDNPPTNPSSAD